MYREHEPVFNELLTDNGLSLCIQGTHSCGRRGGIVGRFIPVYTGNAIFRVFSVPVPAVYPCAYRERGCCVNVMSQNSGLSLCIQGTHVINAEQFIIFRFIPVHTGNSPIITYCFIIKILTVKFLPIF